MRERVDALVRRWRIEVERTAETPSSVLVFGTRDRAPVVLKVIEHQTDEWHAGDVLAAFDGQGVVRVYDFEPGAMLLERAQPATSLIDIVLDGRDEEATEVLAGVIGTMSPLELSAPRVSTARLGRGFERYRATADQQIPAALVDEAQDVWERLGASALGARLLHGDLHHENVLWDTHRGWLAIDPKGVMGEVAYEVGAALRNPHQRPDVFAQRATIERRIARFSALLRLDQTRVIAWGFAQAVLSAIWDVEDGHAVTAEHAGLLLAGVMRPML